MLSHLKIHVILFMDIVVVMLLCSMLEINADLLYCVVLYCIVLYCIVSYCTVLHCIALHCIALHRIALHCIALRSVAPCRLCRVDARPGASFFGAHIRLRMTFNYSVLWVRVKGQG